ncbi:sigma-54-dependent Fis family transcriptional regulator, partial [bacterium]|nr:sigma-54-dependent Fis family transcriptional regulator [bacterium]
NHFLREAAKTTERHFTRISPQAIDALLHYPWPGNATELRDTMESAVLFGSAPVIQITDLPREIRNHFERSGALDADKPVLRSLDNVEEAHIRAILSGTNGNKLRACDILDISRPTLDRKLEKYNIKVEKKRKR